MNLTKPVGKSLFRLEVKRMLTIGFVVMIACTHENVWALKEICSQKIQRDEPRIRNSAMRAKLADRGAHLGRRLAPYAVMAAASYSYADQHFEGCRPTKYNDRKWVVFLRERKWKEVTSSIYQDWPFKACEEHNVGFYARVWERKVDSRNRYEVVASFRGTNSLRDWASGNLMWFRGRKSGQNQYTKARRFIREVIGYYEERNLSVDLRAAGHSLGGGLAQHALYSEPEHVLQAYAFHPSPVTGYWFYPDRGEARQTRRQKSCAAAPKLAEEARIYRIYERGEILAYVRYPFKVLNPISRHISEIRTEFHGGHYISRHSIIDMANELISAESDDDGWLETDPEQCERSLREQQTQLYKMPNAKKPCPTRPR